MPGILSPPLADGACSDQSDGSVLNPPALLPLRFPSPAGQARAASRGAVSSGARSRGSSRPPPPHLADLTRRRDDVEQHRADSGGVLSERSTQTDGLAKQAPPPRPTIRTTHKTPQTSNKCVTRRERETHSLRWGRWSGLNALFVCLRGSQTKHARLFSFTAVPHRLPARPR